MRVGLEVVEAEHGGPLRGRRVGLVAHAASVTFEGRTAVEVLRRSGARVVRLFAPEHGLRSRSPAGEALTGGLDGVSGLPIVSLYGRSNRPRLEDLRDLDALVFDLQDAGVRFYTYASTLLLCLDAAAEAEIEMVVLDRPNPLGGDDVEGPTSDASLPPSLVNMAPGPLVHGLTLGELARFVNARRARPARLAVVAMRGWRRGMRWPDTGRSWVAPSPNLRSAAAALAYPGTCLLEATNVSEGRGTPTPFLVLGAPWLADDALRGVAARGYSLEPTRFVPKASAAAPAASYAGLDCRGVRIQVTDARAARPYALGVALLHELRRQPGFAWRAPDALDRLVGTPLLRQALERGEDVASILARDAPDVEAFRRERAASLLY